MAHALIAHRLAAMAAIEERAKKLKKIRKKQNGLFQLHGKITLSDHLSTKQATSDDGGQEEQIDVDNNNRNTDEGEGTDAGQLKPVRLQVKAALNALIVERNNDPNQLTVGDVFKAIESLRTKRLQTLLSTMNCTYIFQNILPILIKICLQ